MQATNEFVRLHWKIDNKLFCLCSGNQYAFCAILFIPKLTSDHFIVIKCYVNNYSDLMFLKIFLITIAYFHYLKWFLYLTIFWSYSYSLPGLSDPLPFPTHPTLSSFPKIKNPMKQNQENKIKAVSIWYNILHLIEVLKHFW